MSLSKSEFAALKQRISQAYYSGYLIANASEYAVKLGAAHPPPGVALHSTEHLMYLIEVYEGKHTSTTVEAEPTVEAKPTVEAEPKKKVRKKKA